MQQLQRGIVTISALALVVALATAPAALAEDGGVTIKNMTAETQYVLAVFGEGGSCDEMSREEKVALEAGESAMIPSGDSKVCWCSSSFGKVGECGTWHHAKPGSVQKLR